MFFMRFYYLFLLIFITGISQEKYPKNYFRPPMDIQLSISGSFGELRPNHFHTGIDFRTEKREGIPIFATADGNISRIKISTGGYGKSIYIDHPNGFTSVYAHLQKAEGNIQTFIVNEQYIQKKYEIELFPKTTDLIIKKGDLIGFSGNTGSSGGPHLHFEIRDTKSENTINPLFFGYDSNMKDTKTPTVLGITAYPLSENSKINGQNKPIIIPISLQEDGSFLASKVLAIGEIGFGINGHDTSDFNYGKNGIYKLETFVNGQSHFTYEFDSFSFDEAKFINNFIDFKTYSIQKQRIQKLFINDYYPKNIIKLAKNKGVLNLGNNLFLNYKIVVQDFHKNIRVINIPISSGVPVLSTPQLPIANSPINLKANQEYSFAKENISVIVPENTFFENFKLNYKIEKNKLTFHDDSVPIQNAYTVTFTEKMEEKEAKKTFIANLENGKSEYNYTFKKENTFTIKTKKLGVFYLAKDEIAPKIYKPNFKDKDVLDAFSSFKLFISDNLSGIKEYNAYLNDQWILMEHENKLNRLTYNFADNKHIKGENKLKVIVTDHCGNSTTFETSFIKNN